LPSLCLGLLLLDLLLGPYSLRLSLGMWVVWVGSVGVCWECGWVWECGSVGWECGWSVGVWECGNRARVFSYFLYVFLSYKFCIARTMIKILNKVIEITKYKIQSQYAHFIGGCRKFPGPKVKILEFGL
ncbi:hypothetical protein C1646_675795, partial [Rhizophagus diaphanus]